LLILGFCLLSSALEPVQWFLISITELFNSRISYLVLTHNFISLLIFFNPFFRLFSFFAVLRFEGHHTC
jgi:hypothetical protein